LLAKLDSSDANSGVGHDGDKAKLALRFEAVIGSNFDPVLATVFFFLVLNLKSEF
jgi:hypothetical protein